MMEYIAGLKGIMLPFYRGIYLPTSIASSWLVGLLLGTRQVQSKTAYTCVHGWYIFFILFHFHCFIWIQWELLVQEYHYYLYLLLWKLRLIGLEFLCDLEWRGCIVAMLIDDCTQCWYIDDCVHGLLGAFLPSLCSSESFRPRELLMVLLPMTISFF